MSRLAQRVFERHVGLRPDFGRKTAALLESEDGGLSKRNIPKDHPFDKRALKPLAKTLWASTVALGHALAAHRHLSRIKSATVSPDGLLGGRGYVMGLSDMRQKIYAASEALSTISDTLYDEINAPHWKPKLAQLDENDKEDVERFVEEAQQYMDSPEDEVAEDEEAIEAENDGDAEPRSKKANSSLPVETVPGGPRVNHLGPGEGDGVFGDYVDIPADPIDDWSMEGGVGSPEEEGVSASSSVPDASTEDTATEAWDFGIGYGARGQGAGGYSTSSGEGAGHKGVYGPQSGLPGSPSQSSGDPAVGVDSRINLRKAYADLYGVGLLPQDVAGLVSRSDYFEGPSGNLVSAEGSDLPGSEPSTGVGGQPLLDTYYTQEDLNTEYVRYDYTTRTLRDPDKTHPGRDHEEPFAQDMR